MTKRIIATIAAILLVVAIVVLVVPAFRNTVTGWFTSNTQVEDSNGTTEPTTEGTEPTEPTEGEDVEVPTEPKDEEVKAPFTFEELMTLILTEDGRVRVAPKGATIADLSYVHGDFAVESEEEQQLLVPMTVMVNPYGAISIFEHGVENKPAHAGEVTGATIELCACGKWHHEANLFTNWGIQDLTSDEGNLALGPNSWTRMDGQMTELLLNYQEREIIRATACTWTVVNESGVEERFYGIRICGEQKDPEPPVVEPEIQEGTIKHSFKVEGMNSVPNELNSLLPKDATVEIGKKYTVTPNSFKNVEIGNYIYSFKGWDKTTFEVTGDVTVVGTWIRTEKPGEGDEPEIQEGTIKHSFKVEGMNSVPSELNSLLPKDATVEIGKKYTVTPSSFKNVEIGNYIYSFKGWNKTTFEVTGDVTVVGSWTRTEKAPVVENVPVSYVFVDNKGNAVPAEVQKYLPENYDVVKGSIVAPKAPAVQVVETENGTYTFVGYDKSSAVANEPVVFTATWKFKEKLTLAPAIEDYLVTFRVTCTNGDFNDVIKNPAAVTAQKGETVKSPAMQEIIVVTGGKLVWNGWSANSITVVGDAVIDGTYTYHADPKPEHTPTEPADEDPNPVADNQDELDGLGDRTNEVPQNNPEHSAQEELSLMPVGEEGSDEIDPPAEEGINNQHSPVDDGARTDVDADEEDEKQSANNGLSLMPVEGEVDSAEGGESDDLTLSLDLPVDDSEVADQETQDALNAMFGNRE